jgi:hypothetical protein
MRGIIPVFAIDDEPGISVLDTSLEITMLQLTA